MSTLSPYETAVKKLEQRALAPLPKPGLERMKSALEHLEILKWPFFNKFQKETEKIILVAGTNGKGSTSAALESLFRSAGEKTGFYSSPHLVDYCERMRINGTQVTREKFAAAFEHIERVFPENTLTHFEFLTLMALLIFASGRLEEAVDRLILEVGLGGKYDATNAIPHGVCVFTPIDFDHQHLLGSTLSEIAGNKLEIVTPDSLVVYHPFPQEIETVVEKYRRLSNKPWVMAESFPFTGKPGHPPSFYIETPWGNTNLSLAGPRGAENASLALKVFEMVGKNPGPHLNALEKIDWPGRMNLLGKTSRGTPAYASGDHNAQGVKSLLSLLKYYPRKKLFFIVGIGADKDREAILSQIFSVPDASVILTQTTFKALPLEKYGKFLPLAHSSHRTFAKAFAQTEGEAQEDDMIVVTGSLYLVGEAMTIARERGFLSAHK